MDVVEPVDDPFLNQLLLLIISIAYTAITRRRARDVANVQAWNNRLSLFLMNVLEQGIRPRWRCPYPKHQPFESGQG